MKRLLLFFGVLALFLITSAAHAQYTGVVRIDSVGALPGADVGVKIFLENNNAEIAAMTIPVRYFGEGITLDSISYVGSLIPDDFSIEDSVDNVARGAVMRVLPPIAAGPIQGITDTEGLIAELFFSISPSAQPAAHLIDSAYIDSVFQYLGMEMHFVLQVDFSDNVGNTILPEVVPGQILVMVPTDVTDDQDLLPKVFALAQNYPNPFNPSTEISFSLPTAGHVKLEVFNILGQQVEVLVDGSLAAGEHRVTFDGSGRSSGIYFYRLTHDSGSATKKMAFMK
jgi:hypothetical protein